MTELRGSGRHAAPRGGAPTAPDGVEPDEVWVPPPYEPSRPGDFVEYAMAGFQVRRKHRGLTVLVCLALVAALAAGGWWFFLRDRGAGRQLATCQELRQQAASFADGTTRITDGGQLPALVPAPSTDPARICTLLFEGHKIVVAAWTDVSEASYGSLLDVGGWSVDQPHGQFTLHVNGADPNHAVATTSGNGVLVALFLS